tara:strand:- start:1683 stop:2360 length:678 start_codon:yes stop_codon:yes gene_type:complete
MNPVFNTQEVLAYAYAIQNKNNGYMKDTQRFSETTNKTIFSNKDYLKFQFIPEHRPPDFVPIKVCEQDYDSVDSALKHFRRYTLGLLGESLNDFQQDILDIVLSETIPMKKLGIAAYVPELVSREQKENSLKKTIRTEYRDSNVIGEKGDPVEGVCLILNSNYISQYEKHVYTADMMGNLISFWTKWEIPVNERRRIKAKVKAHVKNKLFDVNETQLNYVKLYRV